MNWKKLTLSAVLTVSLLTSPGLALAASPDPARMSDLQAKCDQAISDRLTSLNSDLSRINSLLKLSADQKAKYAGLINSDLNGLTAQKAKCDNDTDLATLKTDYKNIFLNFRIYAVFLPQTNILVASDTMNVTADIEQSLYTALQTRVAAQGNPGNLVTLLADMQAKINDAKTQYVNAENAVSSLTPQSFNTDPNGTKTTLQNARNSIKAGAADLKTAFLDAKNIRLGLKPQAAVSASPTTH